MAYLEFVKVGKIYAEKENVCVGVSDINLTFEKGEIVAVTGKSGAGKSTFLRIAGGLETYEEGELYIEGKPTSHYDDADRAQYLNQYISFVFQNYNILENFTVLENVEYALTQIQDRKERRRRALEIVERVGLKERADFKGSRLSGGEKQRTVIARALAKDSPIILADEPTGNLDSKTSAEILSLLQEVSTDKLLIIVTHNYDDVQHIATRHIRFFNGTVESDDGGGKPSAHAKRDEYDFKEEHEYIFKTNERKKRTFSDFKVHFADAFLLGVKRITSRPRQNTWIACMFIMFGVFLLFTFASMDAVGQYPLQQQTGRVLVVQNGDEGFSESQMQTLKSETGAQDGLMYDVQLDDFLWVRGNASYRFKMNYRVGLSASHGRQLQTAGEIVIRAPYSLSNQFVLDKEFTIGGMPFKIVGVSYYFGAPYVYGEIVSEDVALFTRLNSGNAKAINGLFAKEYRLQINDSLQANNVILYESKKETEEQPEFYFGAQTPQNAMDVHIQQRVVLSDNAVFIDNQMNRIEQPTMEISREYAEELLFRQNGSTNCSPQISLFFDDAETAAEITNRLNNDAEQRYVAYDMSQYQPPREPLPIFEYITSAFMVAGFTAIAVFCLRKLTGAFRSDISVFRTMGIAEGVVKGSTYVQLLLDTVPSVLVTIILYLSMFLTSWGLSFRFVRIGETVFLCLLTILISALVAVYYNRFLYRQRIGKGLRRSNK